MSIAELGALGEFIGSLVVLITLVYLAVQVRQTKLSVQSASHAQGAASMNQINIGIASDADFAQVVNRGLVDADSLDTIEWTRFGFFLTAMFHVFQQHFLDAGKGLGDPRVWQGEERAMQELLSVPGVDKWWTEFPSNPYSQEFRAHVEALRGTHTDDAQWARYRAL